MVPYGSIELYEYVLVNSNMHFYMFKAKILKKIVLSLGMEFFAYLNNIIVYILFKKKQTVEMVDISPDLIIPGNQILFYVK